MAVGRETVGQAANSFRCRVVSVEDVQSHVTLTLREDVGAKKAGPMEEFAQSLRERPGIPEETRQKAIELMKSFLESLPWPPAPPLFASERIALNVPHRIYEAIGNPRAGEVVILELRAEGRHA